MELHHIGNTSVIHTSSFDLEEHLNSESILADITEGAAIVSLDGWVERYNANAKTAIKQLGSKYHLSEIVTEISRFKSFAGIKKHALSMSGLQVCRLQNIDDENEYLTYFSSLRSRVNNKVVAILLQFDFKVSRYNQVLRKHTVELKEHARLIRKYQSDGIHDPLTGLKNRRYMDEYLVSQCELNNRHRLPGTLAIVDIDFFKKVNDTYGHDIGDIVLISLSNLVKKNLRDIDIIGRYGGEEFLIILPNTILNDAQLFAERLRKEVDEYSFETVDSITISMGIVELQLNEDEDELFKRVDKLLYMSKNGGRNRISF